MLNQYKIKTAKAYFHKKIQIINQLYNEYKTIVFTYKVDCIVAHLTHYICLNQ